MKILSARMSRILWDAHAVTGVVVSLGLFVMFYAGAFTLYRGELGAWVDPALRSHGAPPNLAGVSDLLERRPPDRGSHVLVVHPFGDRAYFFVRYASEGERVERRVGAFDGGAGPRDGRSILPDLINDLHYFKQLGQAGRVVAGILSLFGVIVLVSGLLLHWDKLPRALHDFRLHRGRRWAVTDAHTTLGIMGLPYALMYCLTGAFFGLLIVILGPTAVVVFEGDTTAVETHLTGVRTPEPAPSGSPGPSARFGDFAQRVRARWGPDTELFRTDVVDWGDASAKWVAEGAHAGTLLTSGKLVASVATGEILAEQRPDEANVLAKTISVITNLHFSRLGHPAFDALFFLLALFACAVILSGNVLWLYGRSSARLDAGRRLDRALGRATIGVAVGLVVVIPAALILTRLVPLDSPGRHLLENGFFFGAWLLVILLAFVVRDPLRMGRVTLATAGGLHFVAPLLNALLTPRPWADFATLSVDAGLALGGVTCLGLRRLAFPSAPPPSDSRSSDP